MNRIQVWANVEGGLPTMIGERKTPRVYDYAVIARWADGRWTVEGYHRSRALAVKGLEAKRAEFERAKVYRAAAQSQPDHWAFGKPAIEIPVLDVYATQIVPVKAQTRVQCTGFVRRPNRHANDHSPAGWRKCTKTAGEGGTGRCEAHADQDPEAFKAAVDAEWAAYNTAQQIAWDSRHASEFTIDTCPGVAAARKYGSTGCRVHGDGK